MTALRDLGRAALLVPDRLQRRAVLGVLRVLAPATPVPLDAVPHVSETVLNAVLSHFRDFVDGVTMNTDLDN